MTRVPGPTREPDDPRDSYEKIAPGYYDEVYRRGAGVQWFWHRHRFAAVERWLPAGCQRLLDLGCGPGTFLGRLNRSAAYALGLDLAPAQIDYAVHRYGAPGREFRVADVRSLALEGSFDAVVSIEVIEHLPPGETRPFLDAIRRLLHPGGVVILTTPNYRSLWPLLEWAVSVKGPVDYRRQHLNPFTPRRLRAALLAAGFEDVEIATFYVLAPFLAGLSRRLAERTLAAERRWLPALGAELIASGRRPLGD